MSSDPSEMSLALEAFNANLDIAIARQNAQLDHLDAMAKHLEELARSRPVLADFVVA